MAQCLILKSNSSMQRQFHRIQGFLFILKGSIHSAFENKVSVAFVFSVVDSFPVIAFPLIQFMLKLIASLAEVYLGTKGAHCSFNTQFWIQNNWSKSTRSKLAKIAFVSEHLYSKNIHLSLIPFTIIGDKVGAITSWDETNNIASPCFNHRNNTNIKF